MKKLFLGTVIFLFLVIGAGYCAFYLYWVKPGVGALAVVFEVKEGEVVPMIIKNLREKKLLAHPWLFKWYVSRKNLDTKIQSGFFEIKPGLSAADLARLLTDAEAVEFQLTFLEGWNLRDYGRYLENQGLFQAEEMHELAGFPAVDYRQSGDMKMVGDFSQEFDFLADKPSHVSLEGYLFPDTYRFKKGVKIEEIARRLLRNFSRKLTLELRAEIKKQNKTIFEIMTMASLIEAEAKSETDRCLVADVLWRRLAIGMPLQVDSSVNYVTGAKKPAISAAEQKVDSPYNTYKYAGLPLGPINNPGLTSILAAIYPEKNDYWFFLSGKDGVMRYAKNLQEHNENKIKYLK